jgi:methionine-rich copper-binding protein CopC
MTFFNITAAVLGLALSFSASAHISLKQSSPENSAMLMQSPEQLTLTFSGEVRLAKVVINDTDNQAVNFNFKPSTKAASNFSWPLPNLEKGNYTVRWIALGGDGHKMSGTFDFMLHVSDSHPKMMKDMTTPHKQHNH